MRQLEPSPLDAGPRKKPLTVSQIIETVIGFAAWYVINGLIWLGVGSGSSSYAPLLFGLFLILPGNIIVLLICAIVPRLRRVALGILIAMALNFFISLLLGMAFNAWCFVPFFHK
jgi:hypothetical protein